MHASRTDGRLLLALSVPLLPIAGAVWRGQGTLNRTAALSQALPMTFAIGVTTVFLCFIASILDDGRDEVWRAVTGICLAACAVAVFSFNGPLMFALFTSSTPNLFTISTMGMFAVVSFFAAAALAALIANGIGLPIRRHVLAFTAQCAFMGYLTFTQNRWLAGITLAASFCTMLLGLWRAHRAPSPKTG